MRETGFCKTPWALNKGAPRSILRPETEQERLLIARTRINAVINTFGYPPKACRLPLKWNDKIEDFEWPYTVAKDGTKKIAKYKIPTSIMFEYVDEDCENEAWLLFWQSLPPYKN